MIEMRRWILAALSAAAMTTGGAESEDIANVDLDAPLDEIEYMSHDRALSDEAKVALAVTQRLTRSSPISDGAGGVSFLYGAGGAVLVCAPRRICQIQLRPGEWILPTGFHIGDQTRWQFQPMLAANRRTIVIVKPEDAGLRTNLLIHTNERSYEIMLESRRREYIPQISFRYPDSDYEPRVPEPESIDGTVHPAFERYYRQVEADLAAQDAAEVMAPVVAEPGDPTPRPADLDYRFEVDACRKCDREKPSAVFHDGRSTWVILQPDFGGALPTFTVLDEETSILEQRWHEGHKLQIEGLFEEGVLHFGTKREVKIKWKGARD